jgi:hypothetical protein
MKGKKMNIEKDALLLLWSDALNSLYIMKGFERARLVKRTRKLPPKMGSAN